MCSVKFCVDCIRSCLRVLSNVVHLVGYRGHRVRKNYDEIRTTKLREREKRGKLKCSEYSPVSVYRFALYEGFPNSTVLDCPGKTLNWGKKIHAWKSP